MEIRLNHSNAEWTDPRQDLRGAALVSIRSRSNYELAHGPLAHEGRWMEAPTVLRLSQSPDKPLSDGAGQASRARSEPIAVAMQPLLHRSCRSVAPETVAAK
jgi:hypothetical protein